MLSRRTDESSIIYLLYIVFLQINNRIRYSRPHPRGKTVSYYEWSMRQRAVVIKTTFWKVFQGDCSSNPWYLLHVRQILDGIPCAEGPLRFIDLDTTQR